MLKILVTDDWLSTEKLTVIGQMVWSQCPSYSLSVWLHVLLQVVITVANSTQLAS